MPSCLLHKIELRQLLRREAVVRSLAQQLGEAQHGVEGRAKFVAHSRKELALGAARGLGAGECLANLFGLVQVRDVQAHHQQTRFTHVVDWLGIEQLAGRLGVAAVQVHHAVAYPAVVLEIGIEGFAILVAQPCREFNRLAAQDLLSRHADSGTAGVVHREHAPIRDGYDGRRHGRSVE